MSLTRQIFRFAIPRKRPAQINNGWQFPMKYRHEMLVPANLKRKATDDLQYPSGRPSRRAAVESGARFGPQSTVRGPVEPKSIDAILRHHSRDRLFVPPVAWTSLQLRLLNCRFALQKTGKLEHAQSQVVVSDPPVDNSRERNTPSDLCRAMAQFGGRRMSEVKKSAIKDILHAYDIWPIR
ncbi:uncharacterized protein LDX57_012679 [Aspergillus melleus]|uniref:uncharacterized protein n=1 Tax=Aspergillus melleus TaxID=138277 RepID=UPI001E8CA933|nr:uncharacterized protein LDX57_012679 [Aspergillus melleus]KAH8435050.1 hypothetical protein LDX57_012679 [Aspergillus melleus]